MKKFQSYLSLFFLLAVVTVNAQMLKGTVVDETGALPGANVFVKGTTTGMNTDFDGNFSFDAKVSKGEVVVSFVGYANTVVAFDANNQDLGTIVLKPSSVGLNEVLVMASYAVDRKTPVAVSTVKASIIEEKLGSQEFPEILKATPGVYVTKTGGGFGDSRINLRGFNSENVAVMINGVPVNDMENGRVYWSNWAGLSDVTSSMQVQRGLGAAKVAVPSVGGTINILSKTTDVEKGGNITMSTGNDGYQKYGFSLSTGLLENGFASTVAFSKTEGEGYVDGTEFKGFNYFVNISKKLSAKHKLSLTTFGAPQRHGQRQDRSLISRYRNSERGIKFNPNWGYKNGQVTHIEDNFYHKNQTSLNHYFDISENTSLSTALYVSVGTGGGGGTAGTNRDLFGVRIGGSDSPVDLDNIVSINKANGSNGAEAVLRASHNDHNWYGVLSTFKTDLNENIEFVAGVDIREYTGKHYRTVTDLLGGEYYLDNSNENNPNAALQVGDKMSYNNDGNVGWQGLFAQFEYDKDAISAFLSTSVSNTSYQRVDYFNYLDSDDLQTTDTYNFGGYVAKGGANWRIDDTHNVFANIGFFEKAANFDAVFQNFNNESINADAENQKIFSVEFGYGLRSEKFTANLNVYRTEWQDRTFTRSLDGQNGEEFIANILGVDALHQGVEFDFSYRPFKVLSFTGMASFGDWTWNNDLLDTPIFDAEQNLVANADLLIKGLRVADAAQTTAALGMKLEFMEGTSISVDYNYADNLYADFDILGSANITEVGDTKAESVRPSATWQAPAYHLFDLGLKHEFKLGDLDASIFARANNIFNTEYVADARDGEGSVAETAMVWFGFGRTFSLSAKIKF